MLAPCRYGCCLKTCVSPYAVTAGKLISSDLGPADILRVEGLQPLSVHKAKFYGTVRLRMSKAN